MFLWSERFVYDHPNDVIILLKSGQIRRNDGQLGVSFVNLSTGLQRQHNLSYIGPRLLPSLQSSCIRLTVQRMDLSATLCLSTRTRKALVTGHPSHRQDAPRYTQGSKPNAIASSSSTRSGTHHTKSSLLEWRVIICVVTACDCRLREFRRQLYSALDSDWQIGRQIYVIFLKCNNTDFAKAP